MTLTILFIRLNVDSSQSQEDHTQLSKLKRYKTSDTYSSFYLILSTSSSGSSSRQKLLTRAVFESRRKRKNFNFILKSKSMNATISTSEHNEKMKTGIVWKHQSRRLIDPNRYFQLAEKHLRFLSHFFFFASHLLLFGKSLSSFFRWIFATFKHKIPQKFVRRGSRRRKKKKTQVFVLKTYKEKKNNKTF